METTLPILSVKFQSRAKELMLLGATRELIAETRIAEFARVGVKKFGMDEEQARRVVANMLEKHDHLP